MPSRLSSSAGAGVVAALVLAAGAVTLLPGAAPEAAAQGLVAYDDCDELLDQYRAELARAAEQGAGPIHLLRGGAFAESAAGAPVAAAAGGADSGRAAALDAGTGATGATGTNLQERGVDEPDLAKTVAGVLYVVTGDRLQLIRAGASPTLLGSHPLGDRAWGAELLVQGDRVLVLLQDMGGGPADLRLPGGWGGSVPGASGRTRALLLDVGDPGAPRLLEELELDGRYLSARLSDGAVRLVTASTPRVEHVFAKEPYGDAEQDAAKAANVAAARAVTVGQVLPRAVRRNAAGMVLTDGRAVDCSSVRRAPRTGGATTLLVTTLDLTRGLAPQDSTAVTTDGDLVYASADRLYVATSRWGTSAPPGVLSDSGAETGTATTTPQVTTELHAFDTTSRTRTRYAGSGSVPGYVLGRWALSSYDGHLRVATTSAAPWQGGPPTESTVTVLAEREDGLVVTGRVGGLGVGERIYAVRYFGDLATVVTFRQTDPLYVLDLGDPSSPGLVGELKVPGFSTYLHPVGDDLLLGVGQDADLRGRVTGAQVSLFDLSDRSKPRQADKLLLGPGYSPVEGDSRAFGWDAERRLALLPFTRWTGTGEDSRAVGIRVTADRTLVEVGRLAGPTSRGGGGVGVERVLHDADHVYAVSRDGVVAADSDTMERSGALLLTRR